MAAPVQGDAVPTVSDEDVAKQQRETDVLRQLDTDEWVTRTRALADQLDAEGWEWDVVILLRATADSVDRYALTRSIGDSPTMQ